MDFTAYLTTDGYMTKYIGGFFNYDNLNSLKQKGYATPIKKQLPIDNGTS